MADQNNRFDLSADVSEAKTAFLNDVESAAEQVKEQLKVAAENQKKKEQAARSKKNTAIAVAVGAVLVLLIAYWVVFARPDNPAFTQNKAQYPNTKVRVTSPMPPPTNTQRTPSRTAPAAQPGRDSQIVDRPPDDYEQPGQDSGM